MPLSPEQLEVLHKDYEELLSFYHQAKRIVIASERVGEQKISIPAVIEIRSAFDHVARYHSVAYGLPVAEAIEGSACNDYCRKNLNKAHGHLYRAAYDAYDAIALDLIKQITGVLDSVSRLTLFTVIPDAGNQVVKPFQQARELVTEEKCKKDVCTKEEEENMFLQYERATHSLMDVLAILDSHMGSLVSLHEEEKAKEDAAKAAQEELKAAHEAIKTAQEEARAAREENKVTQDESARVAKKGNMLGIIGCIIGAIGVVAGLLPFITSSEQPPKANTAKEAAFVNVSSTKKGQTTQIDGPALHHTQNKKPAAI